MNVFRLFLAEMAKLAVKKGVLISVIAALLVPVVYGGILFSPKWGPYDNLSNLPVAVVNKDKGATSGGEQINVGNDLVADLKKGNDLGWDFVDSSEAKKGLESSKYYMVIEIPDDFSERVTTVLGDNPKKLELKYIQNEGLNFMAAQITKSATEQIREKLGNEITKKYTQNMFASLGDVSDGFQSAADGSSQLDAGITELHSGTSTLLQSLTEKSGDISKLASGSKELKSGTGQMLNSFTAKKGDISKLAAGSKDLNAGTQELLSNLQTKSGDIATLAAGSNAVNAGTGQLLQGLNDKKSDISALAAGGKSLGENVPLLKGGSSEVLAGLKEAQKSINEELTPGTQMLSAGVDKVVTQSGQLGGGLQDLSEQLQAYLAANPALSNDTKFMTILGTANILSSSANSQDNQKGLQDLQEGANQLKAAFTAHSTPVKGSMADGINLLVAGQSQVDAGLAKLNESVPALQAGTASVESGWNTLIGKVGELKAGTSQIADGNQSVNTGWTALKVGATQLNDGASQISAGNAAVEKGWNELTAGASKINSGMIQVSDGTSSVESGWGDLTDGVTQLDEGAGKLSDGSNQLASGLKDGAEKTGDLKKAGDPNFSMFSNPVELKSDTVNKYPFYRDSTAPYVLSLALFVGILIMSLFMDMKKPDFISPVSWFGATFMKLASLAMAQAVLLSIVVLLFLNMKVQNQAGFIVFALFVSLVFTGIVLFFASFGNVGRLIALALVVLQLSTTGANLPIEMLPENLRELSQFLPFTYTISGFKSLISLSGASAMGNIGVLLLYFAVFGVLSLAVFMLKSNKSRPQTFDIAS